MALPTSVTRGVTLGHLGHHNELHVAHAGGLDTTVAQDQTAHLSDHAALRTWAAAAGVTVPEVTDPASHDLAHERLHAWRNNQAESWPSIEDVGSRIARADLTPSGGITTSADGEVVEGKLITASFGLTIRHDNVIVRDCILDWKPTASSQYAIRSALHPVHGVRPKNTLFHNIEIAGQPGDGTMTDAVVAFYCELWLGLRAHHLYIHDVGRGFRFRDDCILEDSYISANYHQVGSTAHRTAVACDGGQRNVIRRNQLVCKNQQSSSALSIYNDAKETFDFLIEDNRLVCSDGYISYGGCVASKAFPVASDVRYYRNEFEFETPYTGPLYGGITSHDVGSRGNIREGNYWKTGWTRNDGVVFQAGATV